MKKKHFYYFAGGFCLILTVIFALYPFVSNYLAELQHKDRIAGYNAQAETLEEGQYQEIWELVDAYNQSLFRVAQGTQTEEAYIDFIRGEAQDENYQKLLNIDGYGMMGYLTIPKINIELPIYHGTDEAVLTAGVGHLEGSSLPAGGAGTHTVLTSHSGYPAAKLFTDLNQLVMGDTFILHILDRTLTYQVDSIKTIIPSDTSSLAFEEGKDYVTLVTCTPYGVNSHRLLVRGVRVD